ncbi:hypothetical protein LTR22_018915 [Elasticomyces elasticus]|nr:hypothetical protein LTR22_018915 [Elasticomyces elasticus]KAK4912318.1 hypothetical protein LTR49_019226 [Elasticomyces elasticus]
MKTAAMKTALVRVQGSLRKVGRCARDAAQKSGLSAITKARQSFAKRAAGESPEEQTTATTKHSLQSNSSRCMTQLPVQQQVDSKDVSWLPLVEAVEKPSAELGSPEVSFAEGTPKLAVVNDGLSKDIAILPDADLFDAFKEAILERRQVDRIEESQRHILGRLITVQRSLEEAVEDLETRIAEVDRVGVKDHTEQRSKLQAEFEVATARNSEVLEAHRSEDNLLYILDAFEQMLVGAKIVEKEDRTPQNLDEVADIDQFGMTGHTPIMALLDKYEGEHKLQHKSSLDEDPEKKEAKQLISHYRTMQMRLYVTEQSFENREERFEREEEERRQMMEAGEEVETQLAFDHKQLETTRRMTQAFILAEEALAAAKAAAVTAGVQVPGSDVESGFVVDVNDGYIISSEDDEEEDVDRAAIEAWMALVPECDTDEVPEVDIDDWDAKSMGISDSMSMVAEDGERRRIDKWWAMCERTRGELEVVAES